MLGYKLPAARSVREFLEPFHVEEPLLWRTGEKSAVPEASAPLAGVGAANRPVLAAVQQQTPHHTATMTYTGLRGYQPIIAAWAEQDLIVHDEFRDGNVLAGAAMCGSWSGPSRACHPESRRSWSKATALSMSTRCSPDGGSRRAEPARPSTRL